ncbi:MAG: Xaa-Pro peptidase family protein [Pirellulaceae bacterium]|jgi:Xaa-Pro aminopeptidase|nr:Xaa-Pro peptidase family protein [Pirellulaceae bacterium]MDP7015037.1 Xaa-Pro peptidase family protein [Pirellulaceae bacterium]
MAENQVDKGACRRRQRRLLEVMAQRQLDAVALSQAANVQWLTGAHYPWVLHSMAVITCDGAVTLAAPLKPAVDGAVDRVVHFEAQWHSTLRNEQPAAAAAALDRAFAKPLGRVGVESSTVNRHWEMLADGDHDDIEPDLYKLRRRKEPDELAMIQRAILATERMYERARQIIEPGVSELHVFNELQAAAVHALGEPHTRTGNDYQCGARGGPPRNERLAAAGELYILDLGPAFRGYFADNCRTIAVTDVSAEQRTAHDYIMRAFDHVEAAVKPGKNSQQLFHEVQAILDECPIGEFNHHLGHGIGLFPHEAPHLNPHWDDEFEVGDVFTAEPGLYAPQLQAGMRIENNYVVTETGVKRLTNFSMDLTQ